jgi:hypothetical protein
MTVSEPDRKPDDHRLRGRELAGAVGLMTVLGVAPVWWKNIKHDWLVDHGYLPEGMQDYWVVFALAWVALIAWGAITRFRA